MDEREVFVSANQALNRAVQNITDSQWNMTVPPIPEFGSGQYGDITLRQVVNYHAYDDAWVPDMMAGSTMEEAGKERFEGDLLGDNPAQKSAEYNAQACRAVEQLDDMDRIVHFSYGDFPARDALKHLTIYRGLHAYDIAKLIGADTTLPDDLVSGMLEQIEPQVEGLRAIGVFPPPVEVPADASPQDRLLGMTGRNPST